MCKRLADGFWLFDHAFDLGFFGVIFGETR
jgi:hypothetical protein